MNKVAKFEKVSYEQFKKDWIKSGLNHLLNDSLIYDIYKNIQLPKRSTKGSAGYDFTVPVAFKIPLNESVTIPTGIRCRINKNWVLSLYPRSGHGFKRGIRLANSVGIVDSDYYNADNEGHILVKLVNESVMSKSAFCVPEGQAFCQGIFLPFGITEDDVAEGERVGGFGSTDK